MAQKNKDSLEQNVDKYTEYFQEDLDAVEDELKKSQHYSEIIDREIDKLTAPSLGMNKGGQHYLIEHITNAVQLQTQRQSLRKDRFAIKKAIMDYAAKFADEDAGANENDLIAKVNELLERDKKEKNIKIENMNDASLDAEIDKQIDLNENED